MKTLTGAKWLVAVMLACSLIVAAGSAAYAGPYSFQYEGIVSSINGDGSLWVSPTANGQVIGGPVLVSSANNYILSFVRPGDLVLFNVNRMADGSLLAFSAAVEARNYAASYNSNSYNFYDPGTNTYYEYHWRRHYYNY